jgi:hypothetical protein
MIRCKDCKYFKRGKWHKSVGGGEQYTGDCDILAIVLKDNNIELFFKQSITVQDTFGCALGKKK